MYGAVIIKFKMHSQAGGDSNLQISLHEQKVLVDERKRSGEGVVYGSNFNSAFHLGPR